LYFCFCSTVGLPPVTLSNCARKSFSTSDTSPLAPLISL